VVDERDADEGVRRMLGVDLQRDDGGGTLVVGAGELDEVEGEEPRALDGREERPAAGGGED
jgi:hypothetical protein